MDELMADTPRQADIRRKAAEFVGRHCSSESALVWQDCGGFPEALYATLAAEGWTRLAVPPEYGGDSGDLEELAVAMMEFARLCRPASAALGVTATFGARPILAAGSPEQKAYYLPEIATGRIRCALALTEPGAGSDAGALATRAEQSADGTWCLTGSKVFITAAAAAHILLVAARAQNGISVFLVPQGAPGMAMKPLRKVGGTLGAYAITLDAVPAAEVLGGPKGLGTGWARVLSTLNGERVILAAVSVGAVQAIIEQAVATLSRRAQEDDPPTQAEQHLLADIGTDLLAAELMTRQAAAAVQVRHSSAGRAAAMAKLFATELERKAALAGLQIGGWAALREGSAPNISFRESLLGTIGGGASQIQRNLIARSLGL